MDTFAITEKAATLALEGQFELLNQFINDLGDRVESLKKDERFLRALIVLKYETGDYQSVFELLKGGQFQCHDGLLEIWDGAHYKQKEKEIGKPLTTLMRFRVRKRNPPPSNICESGERPKSNFTEKSREILNTWLNENIECPYPSVKMREDLARETGLTMYQIKTWFANTRRRKGISKTNQSTKQQGNRRSVIVRGSKTSTCSDVSISTTSDDYNSNGSSERYLNSTRYYPATPENSIHELNALCNRIKEYTFSAPSLDKVLQAQMMQRVPLNQYVHSPQPMQDGYTQSICNMQNSTPFHIAQPTPMYGLYGPEWILPRSSSEYPWSPVTQSFQGMNGEPHWVPQVQQPWYRPDAAEQATDMTYTKLEGAAIIPNVLDSEREVALILMDMKSHTEESENSSESTALSF